MTDIINDLSLLTTIPTKTLDKLVRKTVFCICDAIVETKASEEDITSIDLGIGILYIKHTSTTGSDVKYRFEPSSYLEKAVRNAVVNNKNVLDDVLLTSLGNKFADVYKDLC